MPSEHSPADPGDEKPAWRRRLADDLGEDPGRFLELPGAERRALQPDSLVRARIRGIDRRETLSGWRAYERRRASERDEDPRDGIMRALDAVEDRLDHEGARLETAEIRDQAERRREALSHVDLDSGEAVFLDEDGEPYERSGTHITSSSLVSPGESAAVTDGGRDEA